MSNTKQATTKEILTDIVAHTHALGFLPLVKVTGNDTTTTLYSIADTKSVVLNAEFKEPAAIFNGEFGMPNLDKLNLHLKNPEYRERATIDVVRSQRNGVTMPVGIHFENERKDFENDYRFMSLEVLNEKMPSFVFMSPSWNIEIKPTISAIVRLKLQSDANAEETSFQVSTVNDNLIFSFGGQVSHAGSFVFSPNVEGTLKHVWSWPILHVKSILNLDGDISMKINDNGAMQIVVDSGIAVYTYTLPALSK